MVLTKQVDPEPFDWRNLHFDTKEGSQISRSEKEKAMVVNLPKAVTKIKVIDKSEMHFFDKFENRLPFIACLISVKEIIENREQCISKSLGVDSGGLSSTNTDEFLLKSMVLLRKAGALKITPQLFYVNVLVSESSLNANKLSTNNSVIHLFRLFVQDCGGVSAKAFLGNKSCDSRFLDNLNTRNHFGVQRSADVEEYFNKNAVKDDVVDIPTGLRFAIIDLLRNIAAQGWTVNNLKLDDIVVLPSSNFKKWNVRLKNFRKLVFAKCNFWSPQPFLGSDFGRFGDSPDSFELLYVIDDEGKQLRLLEDTERIELLQYLGSVEGELIYGNLYESDSKELPSFRKYVFEGDWINYAVRDKRIVSENGSLKHTRNKNPKKHSQTSGNAALSRNESPKIEFFPSSMLIPERTMMDVDMYKWLNNFGLANPWAIRASPSDNTQFVHLNDQEPSVIALRISQEQFDFALNKREENVITLPIKAVCTRRSDPGMFLVLQDLPQETSIWDGVDHNLKSQLAARMKERGLDKYIKLLEEPKNVLWARGSKNRLYLKLL